MECIDLWHVDHVIPKSLFRYETEADEEFRLCWSLPNLAPMWGSKNVSKSDTLPDGRRARDLTEEERQEYVQLARVRLSVQSMRYTAGNRSLT